MIKIKENKLVEGISQKYQLHKVVKDLLYEIYEENQFEVFENVSELAKRETWMSDVRDCMKEDLEDFPSISDPNELRNTFMDSWTETGHYYEHVYKPIKNEVKRHIDILEDHCSKQENKLIWDSITWMHEIVFDLTDYFFWEDFLEHHNVYEIASELIIKRDKGEEYFNQVQTVKSIVEEVNNYDELLEIFNGEELDEDSFIFDFHKLKNWTINKIGNNLDVYALPF